MGSATREASAARRVTWVSYAIALASVVGFLCVRAEGLRANVAVSEQLAAAESYLRARPYLEPAPLLEQRVGRATLEQLRADYTERRERRAAPPIPPRIQQREQRELDDLTSLATGRLEGLLPQRFGLRASQGDPASYLTHLAFHGGWLHLVCCLVLLLLLGHFLEGAFGAALFACVVGASALGSAGAFVLQNPGFGEPFIGLTGVTAGLFGAFLVRFGDRRDSVPFPAVLALGAVILLLPGWLGLEWAVARGPQAPTPVAGGWNGSLWALVGGFGAGALATVALRLLAIEGAAGRTDVERGPRRSAASPQLERALQERSAGRAAEAFRLLSAQVQREPEALDACLAFWEVAQDVGKPASAASSILRVLRDAVRRGDSGLAVRHWLELEAAGLDGEAEPALLLRMAPLLRSAGETRSAARAFAAALARSQDGGGAAVASRVAREAREVDAALAARAAWGALGSTEIDLQERQQLEALLADLSPRLPASPQLAAGADHTPVAARSAADASGPSGEDPARRDAIEFEESQRKLALVQALPSEFDREGLRIELADGSKKRVRFDRIEAVAVAAVEGLAPRAVIVVDLVLNWVSLTAETLSVIRLRGDRFDPRTLVPGVPDPADALRAVIERLLDRSGALPLPDLQSARGLPFAAFPSLAAYHRHVLLVD
jgi:membrane associated rhomboid family serine protease